MEGVRWQVNQSMMQKTMAGWSAHTNEKELMGGKQAGKDKIMEMWLVKGKQQRSKQQQVT